MSAQSEEVEHHPMAAIGRPYSVDDFARNRDISREQARELMRTIGRNRDELNAAAARSFGSESADGNL
jgi:hypothetical protein